MFLRTVQSGSSSDDSSSGSDGEVDDYERKSIFVLDDDLEDDIGCLVIDEHHSGFTVAKDMNANVAKSDTVCEDVDECATKSTNVRGRVLTRSQSRAISASVDGMDATLVPSHGGSKPTRSSSRRRKRSCPPMRQLTPPPQTLKNLRKIVGKIT